LSSRDRSTKSSLIALGGYLQTDNIICIVTFIAGIYVTYYQQAGSKKYYSKSGSVENRKRL